LHYFIVPPGMQTSIFLLWWGLYRF